MSRAFKLVLTLSLAACATAPTSTTTGGNSGGKGDGDGSGSDPGSGSNTGSGSGSDTGPSITVTDFLTQMGTKDCTEAFACKASFPATTTTGTFADNYGASVSACETDENDPTYIADVQSEIAAGKITYDGVAADACAMGITYSTCADYWSTGGEYPDACDTALVGSVADGGACVVDYDCSNLDSICDDTTMKCGADTSARIGTPVDGPRRPSRIYR